MTCEEPQVSLAQDSTLARWLLRSLVAFVGSTKREKAVDSHTRSRPELTGGALEDTGDALAVSLGPKRTQLSSTQRVSPVVALQTPQSRATVPKLLWALSPASFPLLD